MNATRSITSDAEHKQELSIADKKNDVINGNQKAIFSSLGVYSKALEYHRQSLGIDEELHDIAGMGADYTNIGTCKLQEALVNFNKALKIDEELHDIAGMAKDYTNIGNVLGLVRPKKKRPSGKKPIHSWEKLVCICILMVVFGSTYRNI